MKTRLLNLLVSIALLVNLFPITALSSAKTQALQPEDTIDLLQPLQAGSALLRFDNTRYATQACAGLTLHDEAANADPKSADTVEVDLYSRLAADQEKATLVESGPDTSTFSPRQQCIPLIEGSASSDGVLQVAPGDMIGALHYDPQDASPRALSLATISGGQSSGGFKVEVDPSILPKELSSTPSAPGEPDFPLALVIPPDGMPALFGEDQVIVRAANDEVVSAFLTRRSGKVMGSVTIPIEQKGLPEQGSAEFLLVRLDPSTFDESQMPYLLELLDVQGAYTYSSQNAVKLIAMILEEQFAGTPVFPHALGMSFTAPVSNDDPSLPANDIFSRPWFTTATGAVTGQVNLGEALTLAEIIDVGARPAFPSTTVAIVDGGFASPADYPNTVPFTPLGNFNNPDYGDVNGDGTVTFNEITQCNINAVGSANCGPGVANGTNPLPCSGTTPCPWHGTEMFSVAGAEFNNGSGSVGTGAHAVTPMFMKVGFPYILPAAEGIRQSVQRGAQVINLSSGFPCRALLVDVCEPFQNLLTTIIFLSLCELVRLFIPPLAFLPCEVIAFLLTIPPMASAMEAAVRFAEARDVVVVAAAGNRVAFQIGGTTLGPFGPFPPNNVRLIPCVIGNTICVGEITVITGSLRVGAGSGFGAGVDIYAPGSLVRTLLPTPKPGCILGTVCNEPIGGAGTSGASAFIAGVAALVRSINPSLNRTNVRNLILNNGCRSASPGRIPPMPACSPSPDPQVNAAPGGYVDVFETVRQTLLGAALLDDKLAACTGGWDEASASADSATGSINIPLTVPAAGGIFTATITGDRSIHRLPSTGSVDVDWYRFQLPSALSTGGDVRVTLTTPPTNFGRLTAQVFAGPATSPTAISPATLDGISFIVSSLVSGVDYFIRVTAPGLVNLNDNCYGGSTLTLELLRPPAADRFEPHNSPADPALLSGWDHTHWLCSDEVRRALGDPERICEGVFENGVAPRGAEELWSLDIPDLSLHSTTDADYFHINIPDPGDPGQGGHADIRPAEEQALGGDPVPLPECDTVQREEFGPPARDNTVNVNILGRLYLQAIAIGNAVSEEPVSDGNIGLYRRSGSSWVRNDDLGSPPAPTMEKVLVCPRTASPVGLDLTELVFSFGESARASLFEGGGYEFKIAYEIEVERGIPDWVLEDPDGRFVGSMPCLGFPGGGTPGPIPFPGGFIPAEDFPFCPPGAFGEAFMRLPHPFGGLPRGDCLADGPGCDDFFSLRWPATETAFDVIFSAPPEMAFRLIDEIGQMIGEAHPMLGVNSLDSEKGITLIEKRLNVGQLSSGLYFLVVDGPEGTYEATYMPPEIFYGLNLPIIQK